MSTIPRGHFRLKLMEAATSLFLLLVLAVILAGFIPLSHPFLAKTMERLILEAGADSCYVGSVKAVIWRSITLHRVSVFERVDPERRYNISFTEAKITANLLKLFFDRHKIMNMIFSTEADLFSALYIEPEIVLNKLLAVKNHLTSVSGANISDFNISFDLKGKEVVRGFNGEVDFGRSKDKPNDNDIKIAFPVMKVFGDGIENVRCAVSFLPEGEIYLQNCTARYFDGKIKTRGIINLLKKQIESYLLIIEKMDLGYWYSVHIGEGNVTGKVNLRMEGNSVAFNNLSHRGELRIVISPFKIENLPLQQSLATSLFIPSLSTLEFSKFSANAVLDKKDTVTASFTGEGDRLVLTGSGWIQKDGLLNQQIEGTFTAAELKNLPLLVRSSLEPASNGGRRFRCRLSGSFNDPRFELDAETLRRAIGAMINEFGKDLLRNYLPK